jgi:N6-L-threonylcarbamoyladenine synthase
MKIVAIDTSCDDTCVALLKIKNRKLEILSNLISSQVKLHAEYGGVYPFLAKREHQKNLPHVFKKALRSASLAQGKIDLIGVTTGPGLEPCLWQGLNFAKDLAKNLGKRLIPINHIEAHLLANWLSDSTFHALHSKRLFPAVCLIVSGGHTQLILMTGIGKYKLVGETRDDAAGECFDKVAKILGLSYPGGPVVDAEAAEYRSRLENSRQIPKYQIKLPRPMIYQKNYDFSFSGLKTAVLYDFRSRPPKIRKSKEYIQEMAAETQQAIIDVLISKTIRATRKFRAKTIILGGGVAASQELRDQFKIKCLAFDIKLLVPSKNLCTDNAAMVAITTYFHQKTVKKNLKRIKADANLRI